MNRNAKGSPSPAQVLKSLVAVSLPLSSLTAQRLPEEGGRGPRALKQEPFKCTPDPLSEPTQAQHETPAGWVPATPPLGRGLGPLPTGPSAFTLVCSSAFFAVSCICNA